LVITLLAATLSVSADTASPSHTGARHLALRSAVVRSLSSVDLNDALAMAAGEDGLMVDAPIATADALLSVTTRFSRTEAELVLLSLFRNSAVQSGPDYGELVEYLFVQLASFDDWLLAAEILFEAYQRELDGVAPVLIDVSYRILDHIAADGPAGALYARTGLVLAHAAPAYPSVALADLLLQIARESRVSVLVEACRASAAEILASL
jgi:hypothetical protein